MNNSMYGYIYLTTNLINGKKYIGQHRGTKFNFQYIGSGVLIKKAIAEYGKQNFSCELLDVAYSKEELNEKEVYWINFFNASKSENYYNIAEGGDSGGRLVGHEVTEKTREKLRNANIGKSLSKETRLKISLSNKGKHCGELNSAKLPQSRAKLKIANHGANNPAFGKHWFTNGIETVYTYTCPEGYYPGRGKHRTSSAKLLGKHWYNNGVHQVLAHTCPDGYINGRLTS